MVESHLSIKFHNCLLHSVHKCFFLVSSAEDIIGSNTSLSGVETLAPDDAASSHTDVSIRCHQSRAIHARVHHNNDRAT